MVKYQLLFGTSTLEFDNIDVALRSAFALCKDFNVYMVVYYDNEVVRNIIIKEEE